MTKLKPNFQNARIDNVPEINLRGDIGSYDGNWIATQIKNAYNNDYEAAKKIRININSFGGSVMAGLTIITAMQLFKDAGGVIETVNECCADSTAGWIFAAGSKGNRKIMQFSSIYTHPPMFEDGRTISDLPEGSPDRQVLEDNFNKIINIFVPITGLSYNEVREMMIKETDLDADTAISNGLADKKILVKNSPTLKNSLTRPEIVNITSGLVFDIKEETKPSEGINNKREHMKKLAGLLNLNAEASDESLFAEMQKIINAKKKADSDLVAKQADFDRVNGELGTLKNQLQAQKDKNVLDYVAEVIKADGTKKDQKENLVNMAKSVGLDAFKEIMPIKKADGSAVIDKGIVEDPPAGSDAEAEAIKLGQEFKNMSLAKRNELKQSDAAKYATLMNAYDKNFNKLV